VTDPLALAFTAAEEWLHLALALRRYHEWAAANSMAVPRPLARLERHAAIRAIPGQDGSALDALLRARQVEATTPRLLLSTTDTAEALGCSLSVVKRLIRAGDLPTVKVANCTRVRVADLTTYVDNLPGGGRR
jgi:excisionase family DNA binding protein